MPVVKLVILFCFVFVGIAQVKAMSCEKSSSALSLKHKESFVAQKEFLASSIKNRKELKTHLLNPGKTTKLKDFKKVGDHVSPNGVALLSSSESVLFVEKRDGAVREWLSFNLFNRFQSRPKKLYMPEAVLTEDLVYRHIYIPESIPRFSWKNYFSMNKVSKSSYSFQQVSKEMKDWLEVFNFLVGNLDIKDSHYILSKNGDIFVIDYAYSFWSVLEENPLHYQKRKDFMMPYFEEPFIDLKIPIVRKFVQELQSGLGEEILEWFTSQDLVYKMLRKEKEIDPFLERLDYLINLPMD